VDTVRWVAPRGTLEVMDDYNLVVPIVMGYYKALNINAKLNPGDGAGSLPQIAAGQYDMGYASPGVLTSALDAKVPVVSIWSQYPAQVFDFVLPAKSKITKRTGMFGPTNHHFLLARRTSSRAPWSRANSWINNKSLRITLTGVVGVQSRAIWSGRLRASSRLAP